MMKKGPFIIEIQTSFDTLFYRSLFPVSMGKCDRSSVFKTALYVRGHLALEIKDLIFEVASLLSIIRHHFRPDLAWYFSRIDLNTRWPISNEET